MPRIHLSTFEIAKSELFFDIKDYNDFENRIQKYGRMAASAAGEKSEDENSPYQKALNRARGMAFEVYTEFFLRREGYGNCPLFGIFSSENTSDDEYNAGYDYIYKSKSGSTGFLQCKFRSNLIGGGLTRKDLGTFISICDEQEIPPEMRVLFTNLNESNAIHFSYEAGRKRMRILGREMQEDLIRRDAMFWLDFNTYLQDSMISRNSFKEIPILWDHQEKMVESCKKMFADENKYRMTNICSMGGGKSLSQYLVISHGFSKCEFTIQVLVSPTIALINQHYSIHENYGFFHSDKIRTVQFCTGNEMREDRFSDFVRTTDVNDIITFGLHGKILIYTTYASLENLISGLKEHNIKTNHICFDEYQYLINAGKQTDGWKEFIKTLDGKVTFWSASIKRGRVVNALDNEIFGTIENHISFKELREKGIVVPVKVIPIRIGHNTESLAPVRRELKRIAKEKGFNAKDAILEAAVVEVAYQVMKSGKIFPPTDIGCNGITFSKKVAILNEIATNDEIKSNFYLGANLYKVTASTPKNERQEIFENVKKSTNSILFQHSVCGVGIDITPFNFSVISREEMDVTILQQGPVGRICRADNRDTENLKSGKISLTNNEGWHKPFGVVFYLIDGQEAEQFQIFLRKFIIKFMEFGLSEHDYQFIDITETLTSNPDNKIKGILPLAIDKFIPSGNINDAVAKAMIETEEEWKNQEESEQISQEREKMKEFSILELLALA